MTTKVENIKRATVNLYEAMVFAAECGQTLDEWFQSDDVKDDPEWQEAYALHRELESTNEKG